MPKASTSLMVMANFKISARKFLQVRRTRDMPRCNVARLVPTNKGDEQHSVPCDCGSLGTQHFEGKAREHIYFLLLS